MTVYLVDKSAWAQRKNPDVARGLLDLVVQGHLACCEVIALEMLYSARNATNHAAMLAELNAGRWLEVTNVTMARAIEIQQELAATSQHRLPIPDLIVAACAEQYGATVLHHDHDFLTIAGVTGQPVTDVLQLWSPHADPA